MSTRITMNTMMRNYNTRLGDLMSEMDKASNQVMSGRRFAVGSEDPASASRAYHLRREYNRTEMHQTNLKDTEALFDTVESSLMQVSDIVSKDALVDVLGVINGTNGPDERKIVAQKLREMQETIVKDMNVEYNGRHLFGGSSGQEPPFVLDKATNKLTYNGVDVTTGAYTNPKTGAVETVNLKDLANEKIYVDLGFGLTFDSNGDVLPDSAYNIATPGIDAIGYGEDANGEPNNIVILMGKLADSLEADPYVSAEVDKLYNCLDQAHKNLLGASTKLGSNSSFLKYTSKRLESHLDNYNEKIYNTEFINPAEAISNLEMIKYSYNAALKISSSILSPSFIDFMK